MVARVSCWLLALAGACAPALLAQDARSIVAKSVELDQSNWQRMKDYTWIARQTDRVLDSQGDVKSSRTEAWETVVIYGEPHRRMLERNGKPLSSGDQQKEQQKLDQAVAKREHETASQRVRRQADFEKQREKDREFLREVPDLFDFQLLGDDKIDGHDVWVISATPKPGAHPKSGDAKSLLKVRAKVWIDKAEYQWVKLEAETTATISFGLFIARLAPGAKLEFEQTRVNDETWLPKREWVRGAARLGLVKKLMGEEEITWNNYRKFQVDSKVVATE
ncbi:MAG TPA: hypothetical protein VFW44_13090 [Bryobacteraceae bacterium]|nr:hypothetical protein [Bryobacteraceae bacterium]